MHALTVFNARPNASLLHSVKGTAARFYSHREKRKHRRKREAGGGRGEHSPNQTGSQVTARTDGRTQRQRRGEGPQTQLRAAAVSIPAACSSLQPRTLKQSLHLNAMLTTKAWSEKYNRHVSRASSGHCLPPPQGSVSAHHSALSWLEGRIIRDPQP